MFMVLTGNLKVGKLDVVSLFRPSQHRFLHEKHLL